MGGRGGGDFIPWPTLLSHWNISLFFTYIKFEAVLMPIKKSMLVSTEAYVFSTVELQIYICSYRPHPLIHFPH